MAEFTEFMNNRVAHFFSMFKELRTGTITYPEIAKRENVRPPINKVCQKLGVKKVAQMTSDDLLLQAIKAVVYDIEMKRRARQGNTEEGNEETENPTEKVIEDVKTGNTPKAAQEKAILAPPGLTKNMTVTNTQSCPEPALLNKSRSESTVLSSWIAQSVPDANIAKEGPATAMIRDRSGTFRPQTTADLAGSGCTPQSHSTDSSVVTGGLSDTTPGSSLVALQRLPRAPPALQCDALELLKVVLAVRSNNGRIQKAIQQVQQTSAAPGLHQLTTAYVQGVVKGVCLLVGCRRLDSTVSHEETISAFDRYVKQSREDNSFAGSTPVQNQTQVQTQANDVSATESSTAAEDAASPKVGPPSAPEAATTSNPYTQRGNGSASTATASSAPATEIPGPAQAGRSRNSSLSPMRAPSSPQIATFKSTLALETANLHLHSNSGPPSGPPSAFSAHSAGGGAASTPRLDTSRTVQTATAATGVESEPSTPLLPLEQVYAQFWELAYKLFLYVCNPYRHCSECLCVVEDIVNLLDRSSNLQSPLTALALDSVVQRAMYELSDKVSRAVDESVLKSISASTGCSASVLAAAASAPDCSVRNIEMCIALMSRSVSPVCLKIRDDFHARNKLPPPSPTVVWCEKVLTLTRQLQELIAWSSPHCQARVPAYAPPGKQYFSATTKDMLFTDRSLQEGDTAGTSTTAPAVHTEPNVADYMSKLSPNSASELLHVLQAKDATLCEVLKQVSNAQVHAQLPPDLESSIQLNLHRLIHQSISSDCSISLCGSAVLGLADAGGKVKIDFAALAAPYHTNFNDLSAEDQQMELRRHEEMAEQLKSLEKAVEVDKLTEIAWKHLKACARDFHSQSQDFILKLTGGGGDSSNQQQQQPGGGRGPYGGSQGGAYGNQRYPPQGGPGGGSQYGGGVPPYSASSAAATPPPPEVVLVVAEDAELIRRAGDSLVEKHFALRIDRINNAPAINQIMRKIEELQEFAEKSERERGNFVRRFSKSLDRVLKENRYLYVRMVTNKVRFTHVNFDYQFSPQLQVTCNVFGCNPIPVQMTEFLHSYISLDNTGKIRDYLQTIKLFAASHHISDPGSGFLSITAWYVMALHVLLRHNVLPNIHMHRMYPVLSKRARAYSDSSISTTTSTAASAGQNATAFQQGQGGAQGHSNSRASTANALLQPAFKELPAEYRERLQSTSLLVLLDLFFRYFVEQINLFTSVITLRDQGTVLPKTKWLGNPVLWRISVEDPFEPIGSIKPYDLGCTLSRPGQLTTFKALRRAVYGIHSIMADTSNDCHENISRLFSKVELIHLARKSDYMGAVITASPAWVRPTEKSVLDSAEYVQHTQLLHCSFDIEEGARLLLPCMDHLSENNSPVSPHGKIYGGGGGMGGGRPNMPYGSYTQQQQQASLSAQAPTFQPNWGPSHIPGAVAGVVPTPMQSHMGVGGGAGQFYGQGMNMGHQQQVRQQHSPPPPMMTSPMMHYKQAGSAPLSMPPSPSGYGMPQQHQHQGAISSFGYHPAAVPTPGMYGQPQQQQQASAYGHPHLSQQQQQMSMPMPMQGVYSAPIMHGMNGYAQSPMQQLQQRMYQDNVYAHHAPQQPVAQQQQQQHMLNAGYAASSSVPSAYASAGQMSRPPQPPQMSPQYPMHKQQQQQPLRPLSSGAYSAQGNHPPHHAQLQQQGRPFDPAAAALAAAAEARYPVGQLVSSQTYDPKGRKYEAAPLSGRQSDYHSSGNVSARSDYRSPYPVPDDRFASGNVSARTNNETPRYQSSEERFGSGNASARTNTETPRYQQAHDMPQLSMQMQQLSTGDRYHSTGNLSARPDSSRETPRFVSMEDRYAKPTDPRPPTEDHRYHSAGNMSARMGSVEGPRYPSQQQQQQVLLLQPQQQQHERNINSRFNVQGSLTARPSEGSNSSRYPASEVDLLTTGSLSARYPSVEERYLQSAQPAQRQQPLQQQQEVFNAPAPPSSDRFVPRLDLDRSEAPVVPAPNPTSATGSVNSRPSALQQSLKLDLQPKFAEDRYALSAADPPVNAASTAATVSAAHAAPGSARTEEQRAIVPPPINIGNLSARRTTTEFSTLVSPRTALSDNARSSLLSSQNLQPLQSDYNEEHYQKPHKSPVVPLIPLEGISSLNSSASSSESNALYSDRSSLYMSTARSDAFGDTARSTIVPAGTVGGSSVYGLPGTGRSTATHHQLLGLSALTSSGLHNSAPNTARSARSVEFDLRRDGGSSGDSEDDYKPFAATAAGGALSGGLTLTSRSRDEVFNLTDRSTDAPHTNRLGYMGLDDLRNRRNAAGGAGGMSFLKGNNNTINEFDEMMERLNSESRSNSQCQSQHSNNRSPVGGDFAPNTARSGHSGHSGGSRRASNASIGIPQEVHEFGIFASSLTPRGLTPRRESIGSSSSGNGSGGGGSGHASSSCNVSGYNSNSTPVPAELKELGLTEQPEGGSYSLGLAAEHSEISDSSVAQKTPSSYLQMIFDNDSKVAPSDLE